MSPSMNFDACSGLKRMPPHDLGHAARDILRVVDVQPAGELQVGRRGSDQAAPAEDRRKVHRGAVPPAPA